MFVVELAAIAEASKEETIKIEDKEAEKIILRSN